MTKSPYKEEILKKLRELNEQIQTLKVQADVLYEVLKKSKGEDK